tara:strand:- start:1106 stop:2053 length:948 start_codon:yes stop_codon:yes gene_type:complete
MIVELLEKTDAISTEFVLNGYQELANAYAPAIYGLVGLSVIIFGYATLQGWVNLSLPETSKRLLTIGFVLELALNWGSFSTYIYNVFTVIPSEVAVYLLRALPDSHYGSGSSVTAALDQVWTDGVGFSAAIWERGGLQHLFPFLWSFLVMVFIIVLVGIALVELVVAKFGLAIFLVLAPLMIPMMLFKATKEVLFDGWLKHMVTFAFIPIFVTAALVLCLSLLSDSVIDIQEAIKFDSVGLSSAAPYVMFLFICVGLVIKAVHMAASIANGFSVGMSPVVARAAQSMAGTFNKHRSRSIPLIPRRSPATAQSIKK